MLASKIIMPTMFGKTGAVVIGLVEDLSKNVGHKVFMDNLFMSIGRIGAVRENCLKCPEKLLESIKELSKKGKGIFDFRTDAN